MPTIAVRHVCHQMKSMNIQIEVVQLHSFLQSQELPYLVHIRTPELFPNDATLDILGALHMIPDEGTQTYI